MRVADDFFERSEDFVNFFFRNHSEIDGKLKHNICLQQTMFRRIFFQSLLNFVPDSKKIDLMDCPFTFDGIECFGRYESVEALRALIGIRLNLSDEQMVEICNRNPDLEMIDLNPHD